MLNNLITEYSKLNFCCGIADLNGVNFVKDKIGYTDILGRLRHNCVLVTDLVCTNVTKIIGRRNIRMSRQEKSKRKTNLNDPNKRSNFWKNKIKAQREVIRRAKNKIECLRSDVEKLKSDLTNIDLESIKKKVV